MYTVTAYNYVKSSDFHHWYKKCLMINSAGAIQELNSFDKIILFLLQMVFIKLL